MAAGAIWSALGPLRTLPWVRFSDARLTYRRRTRRFSFGWAIAAVNEARYPSGSLKAANFKQQAASLGDAMVKNLA